MHALCLQTLNFTCENLLVIYSYIYTHICKCESEHCSVENITLFGGRGTLLCGMDSLTVTGTVFSFFCLV